MKKEKYIKKLEQELILLKKERERAFENTTINQALNTKYVFKEFLEINDNWINQCVKHLMNKSNINLKYF